MTTYRDLIPTKLAAGIWNHLTKYKTSIANFPQTETCDLLVLDRSVDQVYECVHWLYARCNSCYSLHVEYICNSTFQIAPVIHEWTYDAMCHDLLGLEGNKYVYEVCFRYLMFTVHFHSTVCVLLLVFIFIFIILRVIHSGSKQNWRASGEKRGPSGGA